MLKAGGGMDLIFNKLEALQQKTRDEQSEDFKWITKQRSTALKRRKAYSRAITKAEARIRSNDVVRCPPFGESCCQED